MPEGFEVGAAYVRVSPDFDGFAEEVESGVEEGTAGAAGTVKIGADDAELQATLDEAKAKLDELKESDATVSLRADDSDLSAKVDDATAQLRELGDAEATAQLRLDKAEFDADKDEAKAELDDLGEEKASPKLTLDTTEFWAQADAATAEMEALNGSGGGGSRPRDSRGRFVSAGGGGGGGGGTGPVSTNGESIWQDTQGRWRNSRGQYASNAELAAAGITRDIGDLGGDGGGGGGGLFSGLGGYYGNLLGDAGEGAEAGESGFGGLLAAGALGIGALLPGVGGAVAGLGLLGGTGFLGLGGIGSALSDAHQASQSTGLTSQQVASQDFSNQVQTQQAQQSVTQAKQQQAQNAITSNDQIESSEMNLAEVQRNTAASQVQALQSVTEAQQQVEQATYSLSEADYNYGQSVEAAREQIVQLNDQLADSKLSVQAASLAVQQAQYQETLTNQSAYSTDLDREQASLAVAQAKQQLQDATDQEADSQVAANQANQQGVDGSQQVVQAKQAVTAAQYEMTDAQSSYADAQANLTNTELNNAAQVKQAQMQVSQAQEQAAYQAKQDAQSVAQAELNVTNTIKEQQLQWAATQSTENQAANQFAQDMAKLTPSARGLVNQVLGLSGAYTKLKTAAENAIVPGLSVFVTGIAKLMPTVQSGVTQMGSAISKAFGKMGQEMQGSGAQKMLNGLFTNGMQFVSTVLPAIANMVGSIMSLGAQKGAVSGLSDLIKGIADGISGFAQGLKPYIPDFNQLFEVLGKIAAAAGPALAKILGSIAQDLAPLAKFLNSPQGAPFIKAIADVVAGLLTVKGLAKILPGELGKAVGGAPATILKFVVSPLQKALGPQLKSIFGSAFGGAAKEGEDAAEQELGKSGGMSSLIGGIGNMLSGIPGKIGPIVEGIKSWGIWSSIASGATKIWTGIQAAFDVVMDANPIVLVALAIAGLVAGVVIAYEKVSWFRDGVNDAFSFIKNLALDLWHNVFDPMWTGIKTGAEWLYDNAIRPLWNDWIKPTFDAITGGVGSFVRGVETGWDKLEGVFKTPVNFLIKTVYDDGIAKLWNDVVGAVGLGSLKLPVISGLAGGGVLPGYSPGHDSVPAMLSPGEAVLTPGATRAIGGAPVVNALNAAHAPSGGSGSPGHYSLGGIVSGIIGGITGTAKAVTALATGNTTAFVNAIAPAIGTSAAGELGQVMIALPKTLVTDAAKKAASMFSIGGGGGAATSAAVAAWMAAGVKAAGVPASWIPDLEIIAQHESSDNASAVNNSDSNAAAGDPSRGIMQTTMATFDAYHVPGTSMSIFDPVANIAAASRYIGARYGTVARVPGIMSLNQGGQYVGYDSGGALPPGMTVAVNQTGQPEAILNPQQTQWLQQAAERGAGSGQAPVINLTFTGTQVPGQEQMAEIYRQLSLVVG